MPSPTFVLLFVASLFLYYICILIYRLTFHPLAKYPGPKSWAITSYPECFSMAKGNRTIDLQRAHEKYGDIVRTAPNSLSFRSPAAVHDIYSRKANVIKTGWTDASLATMTGHSTHSMNDRELHARRRRLVAFAFSEQALRTLETFVIDRIEAFCSYMGEPKESEKADEWSKPRDISDWATFLTLDVLGELCFGKSFGSMEAGHHMLAEMLMGSATTLQSLASFPLRWVVAPILRQTTLLTYCGPKLIRQRTQYRESMKPILQARFQKEADTKDKPEEQRKDFMHYLMKARDPETGEKFTPPDLVAEAALFVGAGSDTSATTLSALFFYLTRPANAHVLSKLQSEVREAFSSVDDIVSGPEVSSLHYLRACIDESLRMTPPVSGVLDRRILPGGQTVDGHELPEGMVVGAAAYCVHHNPASFPQPDDFIPERWNLGSSDTPFTVSEAVLEQQRNAFIPFSTGPRNCVGKNMAMMELLLCIARIVWLYDMRLMAGDRKGCGDKWGRKNGDREYQVRDWFIAEREGPTVEFKRREGISV